MKKTLLNLIIILGLLLVSACGREPCKSTCDKNGKHCKTDCGSGGLECVDADDWGYPKIWVPADLAGYLSHYGTQIPKDEIKKAIGVKANYFPRVERYFRAKDEYIVKRASESGAIRGAYPDQAVRAIDSGQIIINAHTVPIVITSGKADQWTSWFAGEVNHSPDYPEGDFDSWDEGRAVPNVECKYKVTPGNAPGAIVPTREDAPTTFVFARDLSPSVLWQNNIAFQFDTNGDGTIDSDDEDDVFYLDNENNFRSLGSIDPNDKAHGDVVNRHQFANGMTPCFFRFGMGLYVGFAPNDDRGNARDWDVVVTYHIPDSKRPGTTSDDQLIAPSSAFSGQSLIDQAEANIANSLNAARGMDGYLARGLVNPPGGGGEFPNVFTGDQLFFKIVDRYYNDNEGGYTVKIKEGTRSPNDGPVSKVVGFFVEPIKIIMRRIYEGILADPGFLNAIRYLLVLYIIIYGYTFIIGRRSQEELRKDAVIRIFKIGFIVTLLGANSWDFFNTYLFAAFIDGIDGIAGMLLTNFDNYDPSDPWYSMDSLLAKLFSGETSAKISSTLFSNFPLGIIYIPFLYFGIILFLIAVIKAVIVYIIAFIGIAILISLAPIFFIFMLFDKTKALLEEWWNQLIAFSIQQIILMTALGMFAAVIVTYLEKTLGYRVCWNVYADFDFLGVNKNISPSLHLFNLKFWMPDIGNHMTNIWMDVDGDGVRGLTPPEMAYRYEDLPYFDPVHDRKIIAEYLKESNFLSFTDFLLFLLAIFLMLSFMEFVPEMAEGLKGGTPADTTSVFSAAKGLHFAIKSTFTDTAAKVWKISKSQNTKSLMDEVVGYWDVWKGREMQGLKNIKRSNIFAEGVDARLRKERLDR